MSSLFYKREKRDELVIIKFSKMLSVSIIGSSGEHIVINIHKNNTVEQLYGKIADKLNCIPRNFLLIHDEKPMNDMNKKLEDIGMADMDWILLEQIKVS